MEKNQIAAQLYTCRELLKTPADIAETLKRVRNIGFEAVQVSGMGPITEKELLGILDGEGLTCCATHEPGPDILNEPAKVVDRLASLRCNYTAYPYPAGVDFSCETSVDALIAGLELSGAVLSAADMTLCYHNHQFEFRRSRGELILESIFNRTSPANIKAELDTYWMQFGGVNPVDWCQRLQGRLPLIHLKDYSIDKDNNPEFCEVGYGNLDFPAIIAAAEKSGCEWFIVEQDVTPGDPLKSLEKSFHYLTEKICLV